MVVTGQRLTITTANIGYATAATGCALGTIPAVDGLAAAVVDGAAFGTVIVAGHGRAATEVGTSTAATVHTVRTIPAVDGSAATIADGAAIGAMIVTAQWFASTAADIGLSTGAAGRPLRAIAAVEGFAAAIGDHTALGARVVTGPGGAFRRRGLAVLTDAGRQIEEHIGQNFLLRAQLTSSAIIGKYGAGCIIDIGDMKGAVGDLSTLLTLVGEDRGLEGILLNGVAVDVSRGTGLGVDPPGSQALIDVDDVGAGIGDLDLGLAIGTGRVVVGVDQLEPIPKGRSAGKGIIDEGQALVCEILAASPDGSLLELVGVVQPVVGIMGGKEAAAAIDVVANSLQIGVGAI